MDDSPKTKPEIDFYPGTPPTELVVADLVVGDGAEAMPGDKVEVHYVGVDLESGEEFDSSWNRAQSIDFPLGSLIAGWQQGIPGMRVGGRRQLVSPSDLGYGARGAPPVIKANETLVFVVDLLGVN